MINFGVDRKKSKGIKTSLRRQGYEALAAKKFRLMLAGGVLSLVTLMAGLFIYSRWANAGSAILYPGSCLGSWQNPDKAQGRPEAQEPQFIKKENSAVFSEGGIKEIYCGSFNGDLSENEIKLIKSVTLKFSWLVSDEELQQVATSSITIIQPPATSSEEIAKNTNYIVNQILNNIHADEVHLIVSTTTSEITIITNTVDVGMDTTESTAAIAPISETIPANASSVSEINAATSSPTSFWWRKYSFFFAEDQVPNTAISETAISSISEIKNAPISEINAVSEIGATTSISSLDSPLSPTEDFLKVSYTLDGVNWQALGTVNKSNWQNISFQIPVYQLEDIKKIQIKIESLPILNKTPYVYLDGMSLEVEYEDFNVSASPFSSLLSSLPPPKILKERQLQKTITIDPKASHSCLVEPFRVDVSGRFKVTSTVSIVLKKVGTAPEEIEIGNLPHGIDIVFAKNKDYLYRPDKSESNLDLEITNEEGSQKGSFGIAIMYTVGNSTIICQINIINQ